jgi:hypothetical protein
MKGSEMLTVFLSSPFGGFVVSVVKVPLASMAAACPAQHAHPVAIYTGHPQRLARPALTLHPLERDTSSHPEFTLPDPNIH